PCHAQTGQRTDYEAATPVIGKRLPGVARVHGVWHSKRTGAYAVMRERVRTTWGHYAQERKITRTAVKEGLDAVEAFGRSFITSCQAGKSYRPPGQAMAQLRSGGMLPIVDGLRALAAKGVCVGADLLPQNIGWRRGADRRPEPVMLDMGFSWPAARYRGAVPQPTLAGTRKRRR
ncbi:MAG: hypothetical protein Q7O66_16435, partial [Dehalococcoidia bacterium]|nr:hypothetical protein [Dehalococcoidia bacterium]